MLKIGIIGGGICGISCAVQIAEHFKDKAEVTVISEDFSPNTTGDISGGLWSPFLCGNTNEKDIIRWAKYTHDFLRELMKTDDGAEAGVCLIPCTRVTTKPEGQRSAWKNVAFGFAKLTKEELGQLSAAHNRNYTDGCQFITFTSEPVKMLPYLMKRFKEAGGIISYRKVLSLEQFSQNADYNVIINCTGMGAKDLVPDKSMYSIRGQVIRVFAPWVRSAFLDDSDDGNYIIPNMDAVVLGGTHQINDYNLTPDPRDREFILKGCQQLLPSLVRAREIRESVGLRPGRDTIRLEKEIVNGKLVIHNYGHGGSGVTLAWGCAKDVLDLLLEANIKSKL